MTDPLPSFDCPPVVEVVLGTQFDPIKALRAPQIGLLWQEFRTQLPITEEQPPLDPVIERFGAVRKATQGVSFQILDVPPIPRIWYRNESGTELVQVQTDRFIHNWRRIADDDQYPRYEPLRTTFADDLERFVTFVQRENLGEFAPNQCEVTYVNHIIPDDAWTEHGELDKVLTVFRQEYSDRFLAKPEDARLSVRYVIPSAAGEPLGRLHISADPVFRTKDDVQMIRLNLTARGRPAGPGMDGVLNFLDIGREWVVRAFASITTKEMHRIWRRTDARSA
jgi:uncharacterized protein (TIGR04255 family)